jgi:hypothetical protein
MPQRLDFLRHWVSRFRGGTDDRATESRIRQAPTTGASSAAQRPGAYAAGGQLLGPELVKQEDQEERERKSDQSLIIGAPTSDSQLQMEMNRRLKDSVEALTAELVTFRKSSDKAAGKLARLTNVIIGLTGFLVVLTIVLVILTVRVGNTNPAPAQPQPRPKHSAAASLPSATAPSSSATR